MSCSGLPQRITVPEVSDTYHGPIRVSPGLGLLPLNHRISSVGRRKTHCTGEPQSLPAILLGYWFMSPREERMLLMSQQQAL